MFNLSIVLWYVKDGRIESKRLRVSSDEKLLLIYTQICRNSSFVTDVEKRENLLNKIISSTVTDFKGQVAWISEMQRLPVKTSQKARFYGESFTVGGFKTDSREIT